MHGAVCRVVVLHEGAAGGLLELSGELLVLELERQRLAEDAALLGVPRVDEVLLDLANYDPTLTEEIFCFEHAAKERPQVWSSRVGIGSVSNTSSSSSAERNMCRPVRHAIFLLIRLAFGSLSLCVLFLDDRVDTHSRAARGRGGY